MKLQFEIEASRVFFRDNALVLTELALLSFLLALLEVLSFPDASKQTNK